MLLKLAWRNLWRNRLRTGSMLAAMVFGLLGVISLMGFLSGMYSAMIKNAINWQTQDIQISHQAYLQHPDIKQTLVDSETIIEQLTAQKESISYSPRFIVNGMLASARSSKGVQILGVMPKHEAQLTPILGHITQGEWLNRRHSLVISQKLATKLEARLGSKLVITFSDVHGDVTGGAFRVTGIYQSPISSLDERQVYVRYQDITKLAGIKGFHQIALKLKSRDQSVRDNDSLTHIKQQLSQQIDSQNRIRDWREIQPLLATIVSQSDTSNLIILGIYMLAMCLGIINVILMSTFERTRELGVLMAIGMQKYKVFSLILLEAALLGCVGASLGVLIAMGLMQVLGHTGIALTHFADGLAALGTDSHIHPQVGNKEYMITWLSLVVSSMLAACYPAYLILKRRPIEAMAEKH